MSLSFTQQSAVAARGNVLVAAGAGTGKTRTLVERCVACLLDEQPPASIDQVLMVTFTEAAAAEMRRRIRDRLERQRNEKPTEIRWQEQLALFESAHIGTLHSFCFQLVRQHFYDLGLDPLLSVLAEEEARLLAEETLDGIFKKYYAGQDAHARSVQKLIQVQGRGWELPIRALVRQIHQYGQSLPDPRRWLDEEMALFSDAEPTIWRSWLDTVCAEFSGLWLPRLETLSGSNQVAARCATALRALPAVSSALVLSLALGEITTANEECPRGKRTRWIEPLEKFFGEAAFISSLIPSTNGQDPLAQDWFWVREPMLTLLGLVREFTESFTDTKRELGVLDFQDLEQYSLRLLWDDAHNQPTPIACRWREKLRFVFVDEYQDINAAQDGIIQALSRDGPGANRFLVGDVKQSIYRFRLANPAIFQAYADQWMHEPGRVISLVENFRAREGLLLFINSVFDLLITRELGGIDYKAGAALQFGAPDKRVHLSVDCNPNPAVELHLLLKTSTAAAVNGEDPQEVEGLTHVAELLEAEKEARSIGLRLIELRNQGQEVSDPESGQRRAVDWNDMAILLRSPARKAESYAKEFARLNIPLQVERGGFYQSSEVLDLLSLLQLLDNPLQDLPTLAVLRSPLVGLSASELAEIRLSSVKTRFWTALTRWHGSKPVPSQLELPGAVEIGAWDKVDMFLQRFRRWRRLTREASLSRCLEIILAESNYDCWLLTQPNGQQRQANVQHLVALTRQFDQFQRQGLFRFLKFIEAQQAVQTEPEVPAISTQNAVRLMSIHQSKGLEFPLVVVADLGKPFNLADLRSEVILDEIYGLCPQVKPPNSGNRYPSLAHWLGARRQLPELLGEELRLLYVAMTRARDMLILTGSLTERKLEAWRGPIEPKANVPLEARSSLDWLAFWFGVNCGADLAQAKDGVNNLIHWFVHDQRRLVLPPSDSLQVRPEESAQFDLKSDAGLRLQRRLVWQYPFSVATRQPAKTSVSVLRRLAQNQESEAVDLFLQQTQARPWVMPVSKARTKLSAGEIGSAHHQFLQLVALECTGSEAGLRLEARRLVDRALLDPQQVEALDFEGLNHFWSSNLGSRVRAQARFVHRELAFTARFAPGELALLLGQPPQPALDSEFVLVQGASDLVVIAPREIWLVDFKTDQFSSEELSAKIASYRPQLELYARSLSRVYARPVTESWLHFFCVRASTRL